MQNVRVLLGASLIMCLLPAWIAGAAQEQQPPPTFRSCITLVPVDVRVIGRDGKPVTDLTKADFTIKEDGVPQEIVQLAFNALERGSAAADLEALVPSNRVFLIVLGSGRHVGPVRGIQAAMNFVNQRLLPRDEVAVMAYNRVTAFTTDHQKVRSTIDRYWKNHEDIEWALAKRTRRVGLPIP